MSNSPRTFDIAHRTQISRNSLLLTLGLITAGVVPFLLWPGLRSFALAANFLPHFYCYLGNSRLIWTHVAADGLIGLSYVAISTTLAYLVYKGRRAIPLHWMFLAFGLFIVACGFTHFLEVLTIWIPVYVLSAAVKMFTALASVATAIILPYQVPHVLELIGKASRSDAAEKKFRGLMEAAPDAIVVVDNSGKIVLVNIQTERIFGYRREELMERGIEMLVPSQLRSRHSGHRAAYFENAKVRLMGAGLDLYARHKDGHEFPVEISLSPLETPEGLLVLSSIRDVTERKKSEREIQILNRELERRNGDLTVINQELESFSYSVSHDLRAPLRAIDGFSLALLEDCGDKLQPDEKSHLYRVRAAASRMGQLIDDLLRLARTTRCELVCEHVDLSRLAQEIVSNLHESAPERRASISIAPGMIVEGDRILLRIVLDNLLGNAWKFTSNRSEAQIEVGSRTEGERTVFFVRDNGAGFDMKYADKLFGVFQRLHDEKQFSGTGIGLATVQRIVRRHGGRVWAQSAVDEGSEFSFFLGSPERRNEVERVEGGLMELTQG